MQFTLKTLKKMINDGSKATPPANEATGLDSTHGADNYCILIISMTTGQV
jgi:hypothetical protein